MYEYLEGILSIKNLMLAVIDINGMGFKINISIKTYEKLSDIGNKQKLYIYNHVKEDEISFFGFIDEIEREIFLHCISINGIGAKKALAILSTFEVSELIEIIKNKNHKQLSRVPGIGLKKAELIILELYDKFSKIENISSEDSQKYFEIYDKKENLSLALESLGYVKLNISKLLSNEEFEQYSNQDLLKLALSRINKK